MREKLELFLDQLQTRVENIDRRIERKGDISNGFTLKKYRASNLQYGVFRDASLKENV